jgi:hypothetical protein
VTKENIVIQDILDKHRLFIDKEPGGKRADLSGADLYGAYLSRANFSGANLSGRIPLFADSRRGYVLYVLNNHKEPMFVAGCRTFNESEAISHWSSIKHPDKDVAELYVQAIKGRLSKR